MENEKAIKEGLEKLFAEFGVKDVQAIAALAQGCPAQDCPEGQIWSYLACKCVDDLS